MGIARDSRHKRAATGARRAHYRKKRKFELGRQPAMTKLAPKRIHEVRTRGGNSKYRALRLDSGNFAWGSEHVTRKTRLIQVVRLSFTEFYGFVKFDADFAAIQRLQQRASPNPDPCQVVHCRH
jgi:ribosomal protein eS8